MNIKIAFTYGNKKYNYTFNYRLNFLVGESAIGKSFIRQGVGFRIKINDKQTTRFRYYSEPASAETIMDDMVTCGLIDLVIVDEAYVYSLITTNLMHKFMRMNCIIIVISRELGLLQTVPISPQQYYTTKIDASGITTTVPFFPHWCIPPDVSQYMSEDSKSGNIIWSKVLSSRVHPAKCGNSEVLRRICTKRDILGCIDTLSIAGSINLFETLYAEDYVPLFDVPSVEYLILQALMPAEEIDSIIYASPNPEKKCEELLRKLAPQYAKSKTDTLPCPTDCPECEILKCPGAGQDVLSAIRAYLKNLHPEYNFPWEVEQHTNKFN